ncbi:hypothetical protein HK100_004538, partial [Physocladia obscura]
MIASVRSSQLFILRLQPTRASIASVSASPLPHALLNNFAQSPMLVSASCGISTAVPTPTQTQPLPIQTPAFVESLTPYKPVYANKDFLNALFTMPELSLFKINNSQLNSSQVAAKSLATSQFLAKLSDVAMLRESWLDFLDQINTELKKQESNVKLFLVASWISGLEPYAKSEKNSTPPLFTQSVFTSEVLRQISEANSNVFKKIQVIGSYAFKREIPFTGSLFTLVKAGADKTLPPHDVLEAFIAELLAYPENRPYVLFSFDQVNALYTKTAYFDTDSRRIFSYQFELLSPIVSLLARKTIPKAAVICAVDRTNGEIKSNFLDHLLQNPNPVAVDAITDLSRFSSFGNAVVSRKIAPALYDPVTFNTEIHPAGAKRVEVPALNFTEAYALIDGLRRSGKIKVRTSQHLAARFSADGTDSVAAGSLSKLSQNFVQKSVMVTQ